ncbi:hypothetical protein BDR03DRAFT_970355 [Suillus americanus]|nr:hypothetical protein BDR03DRAFT_970355 [Suillus americanus]
MPLDLSTPGWSRAQVRLGCDCVDHGNRGLGCLYVAGLICLFVFPRGFVAKCFPIHVCIFCFSTLICH